MRYLKIIFMLAAFCSGMFAYGQEFKNCEFTGDKPDGQNFFFVSEVHGIKDLQVFKPSIIRFLRNEYGVSNVLLEMSKSYAYLINNYLRDGDTTVLWLLDDTANRRALRMLQTIYHEQPITIHGIDFERLEFVKAVQQVLARHNITGTALYNFVSSVPDSAFDVSDEAAYTVNTTTYARAKKLYQKEKATLCAALGADSVVIKDIFENPASQTSMRNMTAAGKERNISMMANIAKLPPTEKYICFVGADHLDAADKTSLLSRYIAHSGNGVAVIDMICRNCYISSYYGTNVHLDIAGDNSNDAVLAKIFDRYYRDGNYRLINQKEIRGLKVYNKVPTYYVLFKDQPKW